MYLLCVFLVSVVFGLLPLCLLELICLHDKNAAHPLALLVVFLLATGYIAGFFNYGILSPVGITVGIKIWVHRMQSMQPTR